MRTMTSREEIERLLNQTGRTLEGLPNKYSDGEMMAAIIFASTLGAGVMLSASLLFLYQGSITLLAQFIEPFLTDPVIAEMNCVGNVIIIGLAMNMLGISKFKVMNLVPAIFLPILLCRLLG